MSYDEATQVSLTELAKAFHLIRRLCPDLAVTAIQWLYVKHPIYARQERIIRSGQFEGESVPSRGGVALTRLSFLWTARASLRPFIIGLLYAARTSLAILRMRWRLRGEIHALKRQRFDLVAKTWGFGIDRPSDGSDFYYGDLQRRLLVRGVRMLLLCGDGRGSDPKAFAESHTSTTGLCELPELSLVSPFAPIRMMFEQLRASFRLRLVSARARHRLLREICALASLDCLSPATTYSSLYFWIAKAAVRTWHPRAFVTLYEGNSWEKCAWLGVKSEDPSCGIVAYQHTALYPESLSLTGPYAACKGSAAPDVVLVLGEVTRDMMVPGYDPHRTRLVPFGSFRRIGDDHHAYAPRPKVRTVLVIPEGILEEAKLIFDFAVQVASVSPDHRFIFRCHPALPFERVRPHMSQDPEGVPNIELSPFESIIEDFSRSSVALYRGSSAVLYAVLYGLKPVYLRHDRHRFVDPLFKLRRWREFAGSVSDMENLLRRYAASSEQSIAREWQAAAAYANDYTRPVDEASVDRFLASVGLQSRRACQ